MLEIIVLVLSVAALWFVWTMAKSTEKFQPELRDTRQDRRTQDVEHSSHEQRTNHMPFMSFVDAAQGMMTPFRVNAYTAVR